MAAKKKAAASPPVDVPSVLLTDEYNPSIARTKTAVAKKWSLTRAESLADAAQLGWFLVAVRREREANELVDHISDRVIFDGNQTIWAPASSAIVLAARLARLRNDEPRRASLTSLLVANPAIAAMPRDAFLKWVAEANKDLRSAEVESSQKWACQGFARACVRAAYFRETAAEAAYEEGTVDITALDDTIAQGLAGLSVFLAR